MRLQPLRIAHVNLSIADVPAARAFYGEVLGLDAAPRPSDAARPGEWFRLGAIELHLSLDEHTDGAKSKRHVAFEVSDLDGWRRRFAERGIAVDEGRVIPGVRRVFVRDPSGNRIELFASEPTTPER